MKKIHLYFSLVIVLFGCREGNQESNVNTPDKQDVITYAKGFNIEQLDGYSVLTVSNPWPGSDVSYRYLLKETQEKLEDEASYEAVLQVPIRSIVVTSTTHIPSLEMLGAEETLVGFPNLNYISSEKTRSLIDVGKIRELGQNEAINTEVLIESNPDAVVTFAIEGKNKTVTTLQRAGIPVLYNADWTETHPLGKAEWIKFFGALYGKAEEANQLFSEIEKEYLEAKTLAANASTYPTVLSGAMYKDIWYLPQGGSWAAQFIADAHGDYLWKDREGTGSLSLNLESVLETGRNADYWIGPGQYNSYYQLQEAHSVYGQFKAFETQEIYTFTTRTGATGGVLYYELAPNRPDLVLKDLIKILHPELLPEYSPYFFAPLAE